jgi:hypothetical protein
MKNAKRNPLNILRNDVYDYLVLSLNTKSKFYTQDCDDLWAGLLKKSADELRETLNRQRAIYATTHAEIIQNCQV